MNALACRYVGVRCVGSGFYPWRAQVSWQGHDYSLGGWKLPEKAAQAHDEAALCMGASSVVAPVELSHVIALEKQGVAITGHSCYEPERQSSQLQASSDCKIICAEAYLLANFCGFRG